MKIIYVGSYNFTARRYCLATELTKQGHEIHYLRTEEPYRMNTLELLRHLTTSLFPKQYQHEGITIHPVRRLPYYWLRINGWLFKLQIRNLYRELSADIIFTESHTNETEIPKDLPFIYDLIDDYPAVAEVYGSRVYKLAFKLLEVRTVMKRQCQNALAVTAVSNTLCDIARKYSKNVVKLPNGVESGIIRDILLRESIPPNKNHSIVYATAFGQWSRAIETMEAIVELHEEYPDINLTLIGSGTETNKIIKFIKDNNADSFIKYLGYVYDRKKLFSLINQSAIGLNISDKNKWRDAAHPMKVMDYSALGKKVVSTDLTEVKALNFPNVFLFSKEPNEDDLLGAIRRALDDKKQYANVSKIVLREYNWEDTAKKLVDLIQSTTRKVIS